MYDVTSTHLNGVGTVVWVVVDGEGGEIWGAYSDLASARAACLRANALQHCRCLECGEEAGDYEDEDGYARCDDCRPEQDEEDDEAQDTGYDGSLGPWQSAEDLTNPAAEDGRDLYGEL